MVRFDDEGDNGNAEKEREREVRMRRRRKVVRKNNQREKAISENGGRFYDGTVVEDVHSCFEFHEFAFRLFRVRGWVFAHG